MFIKIICVLWDLNAGYFLALKERIEEFYPLIFCNNNIFEWKFGKNNFLTNHVINEFDNRFKSIDDFWIIPLRILPHHALV